MKKTSLQKLHFITLRTRIYEFLGYCQQVYEDFCVLRSLTNNVSDDDTDNDVQIETNGKRKQVSVNKNVILSKDDNNSTNLVAPPTSKQKLSITNSVGNYF